RMIEERMFITSSLDAVDLATSVLDALYLIYEATISEDNMARVVDRNPSAALIVMVGTASHHHLRVSHRLLTPDAVVAMSGSLSTYDLQCVSPIEEAGLTIWVIFGGTTALTLVGTD